MAARSDGFVGCPAVVTVSCSLLIVATGLCDTEDDIFPGGDSAENTTGVVLLRSHGAIGGAHERIVVLRAAQHRPGESGSDLEALDRVDAEHRLAEFGVQFVEYRLAESGRIRS